MMILSSEDLFKVELRKFPNDFAGCISPNSYFREVWLKKSKSYERTGYLYIEYFNTIELQFEMRIKVFVDYEIIEKLEVSQVTLEKALIEICKKLLHEADFCVDKKNKELRFVNIPVKEFLIYDLKLRANLTERAPLVL